jgi:glutamine synthetase
MRSTGLADEAYFGPENEFFIFDDVRWASGMNGASYAIESYEGAWQSDKEIEEGNLGHRPGIKGGYFPVPPVDSLQDIRSAMCLALEEMGLSVEVHHHEVATAGQCEIGVKFGSLVKKADDVMTLKYVIHNVAHSFGKTATFMPKPLLGDNGSGMHVHQSLAKGGKNLFQGDLYGGLSQTALYYIGGIMKHAHAINALTNASTNSYKRLVKGFEAPTLLAYSARNRSASIRVPYVQNPNLGFTAMLMAGLDGIANKINPGPPSDKDLYDLPPEEEKQIRTVSYSLTQSLEALDKDRGFLTAGGVLNDSTIDAYIALKEQEITRFSMTPHPVEFEMYYSL